MSYSNSFPQQRPSLNLVFNGGSDQLDSRISFSRADTPPTYSAPSGVHFWSNEKHLSTENLIPYSNDLSQSVWTKRNLTVPATNIVAPDGTSSASSLLETSATSTHDFYEEFSAVSGTSYTFTLYAKANGRDTLQVKPQATSTIASVVFDLTAVTSTVISGSADSHSITAIGSTGWYKLQLTVTATASGTGFLQTYFRVGGVTSYAGDATKGAYIWGCQVSSTGETFLNATSGSIHREFASTLKSVANAGDPRFEYDPTDGQSAAGSPLGLLIEAQATNLQRYGSAFASWNNFPNITVTSNAAVAPNGLLEADLVVASSTPASTYVYDNSTSIVSGTTYTASTYIKSAGQRYVQLLGGSGSFHSDRFATFDLQTGSVDTNGGVTASAVSVGNGWWRIEMSILATGTSTAGIAITFVDSATSSYLPTFTGNDYDGFLLWGFQLETGSSASSLANSGTSSSGVTRAADSCSVALSDVGITSGQDLTAIVEGEAAEQAGRALIGFDDGSSSNYARILRHSNNNYTFDVRTNAVSQALITLGSSSSDTNFAFRVENNNIGASAGGSSVTTDTSATIGLMTTMQIGNAYWGGEANGTISRVAIYSEPLADANLTALSS